MPPTLPPGFHPQKKDDDGENEVGFEPASAAEKQLRDWREARLLEAGVEPFVAWRLALAGADWHQVAHWKELGMSDDLILDQFLEY